MAVVDAVLSYHTSAATCGTAKFNQQLARRLGVPFDSWSNGAEYRRPLFSLKPDELECAPMYLVRRGVPYDLFLHALPSDDWQYHIRFATTAYAANETIAREMRKYRPDVTVLWCPSTIQGNPTRGSINVLTFGMAHKIQTTHYETLKRLLDETKQDYTVSVSTAVHEGSPWDETVRVGERLGAIFGHRLRVLGYLADDALSREIRECSAAAIFYDPAFRGNNTSGWAVVEAGKPFITNHDADSPNVGLDIQQLTEWPLDFWHDSKNLGQAPTWEALVIDLGMATCAKS